MTLSFAELAALAGKRQIADAACPMCGPSRKSPHNRVRPTLRIWAGDDDFISYYCARCSARGLRILMEHDQRHRHLAE